MQLEALWILCFFIYCIYCVLFFLQYCELHCCSRLSALGSRPELTGWNQQVEIVGTNKVLPGWKETRYDSLLVTPKR